MDAHRFDRITRAWASPATRWGLIGGILGAGVAGLIGRIGIGAGRQDWTLTADAADAECMANADPEYETQCRYRPCGDGGICVETTSDAWRCVGTYPASSACPDPKYDFCEQDDDCRADWVCARFGGCCRFGTGARRKCMPRIGSPATTPAPPTPTLSADERRTAQAAADAGCAANPDADFDRRCSPRPCNQGGGVCVVDATGAWRCTETFGFIGDVPRCPSDMCRTDADCGGAGWFCGRLGGCCEDPRRLLCLLRRYDRPDLNPIQPTDATPSQPMPTASSTSAVGYADSSRE